LRIALRKIEPGAKFYAVVDKSDGAIIIALQANSIYLVEQFRYTIFERCLEMPQGAWEGELATPEDLARGELREELPHLLGAFPVAVRLR